MAINSLNNTMVRLSGVSSGLDTDLIIDSMLQLNQARVDKQNQSTTKLEWKADALREVNALIRAFRESNLSVLSASGNMLSAAAYNTFAVTMLTPTNAVTVSAGSQASAGALTIGSISQLAAAANIKSMGAFTGAVLSYDTKLSALEVQNAFEFDEGEISFSINGIVFTFDEKATLGDLLNAVNASDAGVRMTYSSLTKGFAVTAKNTGSTSTVDIVNSKGNAFASANSAFGIAEGTVTGQDVVLMIEGIEVTRPSNSFTIDGITYALKTTSDTAITFTVDQNLDATVDKIAAFIDAYNTLIGKLQGMIDQKAYRTYPPLTGAQKAQMSEAEIKLWEDYAKSGLLRGDANISGLLSTARNAFIEAVEGIGLSASDIGLTTGAFLDKGKIIVDKQKLRSALEDNPEAVKSLFVKTTSSGDSSELYAGSGLVVRISNALLSYTQSATSHTLLSLDKQISDSKKRTDDLMTRMTAKESALWKRFTAMEKALSVLNSQSSWLSALTTSWSNNK